MNRYLFFNTDYAQYDVVQFEYCDICFLFYLGSNRHHDEIWSYYHCSKTKIITKAFYDLMKKKLSCKSAWSLCQGSAGDRKGLLTQGFIAASNREPYHKT